MAIAMSSAFTARAGTLYTIDVASNELQTFDTRTLQFTNVAAIAPNSFNFGDLAYSGSAMYMTQGFAGTGLYTLNLTTGAETLVGDMGRNDMFGLAFDQTGTLYGSLSSGGFTGLYSINPNNAAINLIGDPGHYLDGLTYLPTQNLLLGLNAGAGTLYGVNRTTGATTLLGGNQFINNCGIAYDPDTGLVWCLDWSGNVFTFNPNNNFAETLVMSGQDAHDGLASTESAAPEPATIAGVLVGFAALLRRRRK
jgi:hypothetical protein